MIDGENVLLYIALTPSQWSQQSSQVNTFKVCTHLALRAALLPIRSESLLLHIEGRMWNWFSQQTYRESLVGHVPHLNSLKVMPHPVGGSCWKEECDSASTSETNTGWREEDHSAPNIISPVFPVPFPVQFFISGCWYVRTAHFCIRQVSDGHRDWLANLLCLPWQTSSDWQSPLQSCGGFPQGQSHQYWTKPHYWMREGGRKRVWGWVVVVGVNALWVLSDVIWSVIVVLPLEVSRT